MSWAKAGVISIPNITGMTPINHGIGHPSLHRSDYAGGLRLIVNVWPLGRQAHSVRSSQARDRLLPNFTKGAADRKPAQPRNPRFPQKPVLIACPASGASEAMPGVPNPETLVQPVAHLGHGMQRRAGGWPWVGTGTAGRCLHFWTLKARLFANAREIDGQVPEPLE